jgi:rubredoxin
MAVCVKCVDVIETKNALRAGWERIDGRWHCPVCKVRCVINDKVSEEKEEEKRGRFKNSVR